MTKQLAIDKDGNLSYCSVPPEMRGVVRGCTHIGHSEPEESTSDFIDRAEKLQIESGQTRISEQEREHIEEVEDAKSLWVKENRDHADSQHLATIILYTGTNDDFEIAKARALKEYEGTGLDLLIEDMKPLEETGGSRSLDLDGNRYTVYRGGSLNVEKLPVYYRLGGVIPPEVNEELDKQGVDSSDVDAVNRVWKETEDSLKAEEWPVNRREEAAFLKKDRYNFLR